MRSDIIFAICKHLVTTTKNDHNQAIDRVKELKIKDINIDETNKIVTITTKRPGLFIGLRGNDYDQWKSLFQGFDYTFRLEESKNDIEDELICCISSNFDESLFLLNNYDKPLKDTGSGPFYDYR